MTEAMGQYMTGVLSESGVSGGSGERDQDRYYR